MPQVRTDLWMTIAINQKKNTRESEEYAKKMKRLAPWALLTRPSRTDFN